MRATTMQHVKVIPALLTTAIMAAMSATAQQQADIFLFAFTMQTELCTTRYRAILKIILGTMLGMHCCDITCTGQNICV